APALYACKAGGNLRAALQGMHRTQFGELLISVSGQPRFSQPQSAVSGVLSVYKVGSTTFRRPGRREATREGRRLRVHRATGLQAQAHLVPAQPLPTYS